MVTVCHYYAVTIDRSISNLSQNGETGNTVVVAFKIMLGYNKLLKITTA